MSGKTCVICGEPSGMYPLCRKHLQEKQNGYIIKCEECGVWHYVDQPCKCKKQNGPETPVERARQEDGKCIICGEEAPNGPLCRDCYYEMVEYKDSFDKNAKVFELKDYYFNLRSNIYRMSDFEHIQSNCNKLMALAVLTKALYEDESLTDRIVNDIKTIIEKKKPNEEQKTSAYSKTKDSKKEEIFRTADGHYVKSNPEVIIDDILYNSRIVHCYEQQVPIGTNEPAIYSDWFIPVTSNRHGIYIEYWGMNTKEYLENKKRKQEAYHKYNIPLIEIEKDDLNDHQGLQNRLLNEIQTKKIEIISKSTF